MRDEESNRTPGEKNGPSAFMTTHWTDVMQAGDPSSPQGRVALEKLCKTYWYPLYAFARRQGNEEATAKDLTQGFFAILIEKASLTKAQPEKGKFRSFLLARFKHFMTDERDKARALKRGGDMIFFSINDTTVEDRYSQKTADGNDPEKLYERHWASTLLEEARRRLEQEYANSDKRDFYKELEPFVLETGDAPPYALVAPKLGISEGGVRNRVHSMRQRYHQLVREEVFRTVGSPAEVDEELKYLIRIVSA
jgi:RNA polymerase sigma-70 factor (ECF subfamily)